MEAATIVSGCVTLDALRTLGRDVFAPDREPPADASLVVAYALMVATVIFSELEAEGARVDLGMVMGNCARMLFADHASDTELDHAKQAIQQGKTVLDSLLKSPQSNIKEWIGTMHQLVRFYVMQATTDNLEFKNLNLPPLLGSAMESLLKAA